jgi:hypothetical protein
MNTKVLALLPILLLGACAFGAQVSGDVAADAASAAAIATATGDTEVVQCYMDIGAVGAAVASASTPAGASMTLGPLTMNASGGSAPKLLTKLEATRAIRNLIADPNCSALELSLVSFGLKSVIPGAGALIP